MHMQVMRPVLDSVTGSTRLVIATQREETKALLAGGQVRSQKSDFRSQKSEVRGERSEVRSQ